VTLKVVLHRLRLETLENQAKDLLKILMQSCGSSEDLEEKLEKDGTFCIVDGNGGVSGENALATH
jgi:hypothetical protein